MGVWGQHRGTLGKRDTDPFPFSPTKACATGVLQTRDLWAVAVVLWRRGGSFLAVTFGRERPSLHPLHLLLWRSVFNDNSYLALEDNHIHSESWHMLVESLGIDLLKYLGLFVENKLE